MVYKCLPGISKLSLGVDREDLESKIQPQIKSIHLVP